MRMIDPMVFEREIANLLVAYPELADDEVLRHDMLEGSTDLFDGLSRLVRQIGETEALAAGNADYVMALKARNARLERRTEAFRRLIFKLMEAASLRKAELASATLSIRAGTPKVVVTDEEVDRLLLRIKRGTQVFGAHLRFGTIL